MHHILLEVIPSKQCGIGVFKELAEVNHAVFEKLDQISDYAIGSFLGEGHFVDVKSCNHLLMQKQFAVKIIPKQKIKTLACLQRVQTERYLLKKLDHPNIVQFVDFINSPKCLYLITKVGGKDLFDFLTPIQMEYQMILFVRSVCALPNPCLSAFVRYLSQRFETGKYSSI